MSGQAASRAVQRRGPMRVRVIRVKRGFSSALTVIALFAYDVNMTLGVHVCVHHQATSSTHRVVASPLSPRDTIRVRASSVDNVWAWARRGGRLGRSDWASWVTLHGSNLTRLRA